MRNHSARAGFSLLQLSILLTVGALMLAALLPAGAADDVAKTKVTIERMEKIEAAAQRFMTSNHRRPYPSSLIAGFDATAFGIELTPPIDYSSVPTTHFTSALLNLASSSASAGSKTLTVSDTSGLNKGWLISGNGIPSGTWVEAITSATTLTMSQAATATGTITASFRNPLVAGGVPTKSLGLPDEYAIDGFGRRILYMVDSRATRATSLVVSGAANNGSGLVRLTVNATSGLKTDDVVIVNNVEGTTEANGVWKVTVISSTTIDLQGSSFTTTYTSGGTAVLERNSCMALQHNNLEGALALSNSDDFSTGTYDHVMWALLSYGKDGQGAMGIQGSALSSRIKTGNTDASTLNNAFYDNTQVTSYAPSGLVNKFNTNSFDDIVWLNQATKNICGMGETVVSTRDFRIDGGGTADSTASAASGDINGDGWPDIVLGVPQQNAVRVIFGRKDNWPEPNAAYKTASLDGNNGFTISGSGSFGEMVATGDVNGDGYDDVIAGNYGSYFVIFGAAAWPATYTIGDTSPTTATAISGLVSGVTSHVAVGDVNGDGYDDIALPFYDSGTTSYYLGLINGASSLAATIAMDTTLPYFKVAVDAVGPPVTPNTTTGQVSFGATDGSLNALKISAVCDFNADGYDDIIVPGAHPTYPLNRVYIYPGASTFTGVKDPNANGKQLTVASGYDIKSVGCKDINNDTYEDVLLYAINGSQEYLYAYYGSATINVTTIDLSTSSSVSLDLTSNAPSWKDNSSIPHILIADLNHDGRNDIVLSRSGDDPNLTIADSSFTLNNSGAATRSNAGVSYVLYQPSGGYSTGDFYGTNFFTFDDTKGAIIVGGRANEGIEAQADADINKDGKTDLLFSSNLSPTGGYLMFGKSYDTTNNTGWARGAFDLLCSYDKSGGETYTHCPEQLKAK